MFDQVNITMSPQDCGQVDRSIDRVCEYGTAANQQVTEDDIVIVILYEDDAVIVIEVIMMMS